MTDTSNIAAKVLEREAEDRQALALLLDQALSRDDKLLVERTQMGGAEAYIGSVELAWVDSRVGLAENLPLLRDRPRDEKGHIEMNADTIDLIMQRPIDWTREYELAEYLIKSPNHKFPPILVVVTRDWVDNDNADEWGKDGRAVRSSTDFEGLDNARRVGLLDLSSKNTIYALDGQHRVIGIGGLIDLLKTSQIQPKRKDGKTTGDPVKLEELLDRYGLTRPQVQAIPQERIGVEFIPTVIAGETREEARHRVASIFVHVNKTTAPLSVGELAQLDQDYGFAIVARRQAVAHDFLKVKSGRKARVNFNSATIAPKATVLTTLQTLKEMAERYVGADDRYGSWALDKRKTISTRPSDKDLDAATVTFGELLTHMAGLPSYAELDRGSDTGPFRRFPFEKDPGQGHMLFRPIGQIALAQAVGHLHHQHDPAISLDEIFNKFASYDAGGGFRMDDPSSLWYGVLYDPLKQKMLVSGRDLAARLLQYLVAGLGHPDERESLRSALAKARRTEGRKSRDFDGKEADSDKIQLPPIL